MGNRSLLEAVVSMLFFICLQVGWLLLPDWGNRQRRLALSPKSPEVKKHLSYSNNKL
ncbi:MAG: hypothetical protein LKE53_02095 [Oscillospiraceae bacterium]|jgi:hypothetical protein|nr:hypothetical protein [Oscillospiraceae bacterium]